MIQYKQRHIIWVLTLITFCFGAEGRSRDLGLGMHDRPPPELNVDSVPSSRSPSGLEPTISPGLPSPTMKPTIVDGHNTMPTYSTSSPSLGVIDDEATGDGSVSTKDKIGSTEGNLGPGTISAIAVGSGVLVAAVFFLRRRQQEFSEGAASAVVSSGMSGSDAP